MVASSWASLAHDADGFAEGGLDQDRQALGILFAADFVIKAAPLRAIAPVHWRVGGGGEGFVGIRHEADPAHDENADDHAAIQLRGIEEPERESGQAQHSPAVARIECRGSGGMPARALATSPCSQPGCTKLPTSQKWGAVDAV